MRFLDALKMALHNIWHNKSRTALTVIIVLIVGTLLMVLNIFALSFSHNMNLVSREVFNAKGTEYSFSQYWERGSDYNNQPPPFTKEELKIFSDSLEEYSDIVDTVFASGDVYNNEFSLDLSIIDTINANKSDYVDQSKVFRSSQSMLLTSFIIPAQGADNFVLEGRTWNKNDKGTASIWITDSFLEEVFKENGVRLRVGDELVYLVYTYNYTSTSSTTTITPLKLTVKGILEAEKLTMSNDYYGRGDSGYFLDMEYYLNVAPNTRLYSIRMSYLPLAKDYNFNTLYSRLVAFENSVNSASEMRHPEYDFFSTLLGEDKRFSVGILSQMSMVQFLGTIVIGLVLAISLVIVLLSAGSIANSIIISTDKNKKFIGLMKALGLKNKGVNRIINLEAALQIFIGIAVSFLLLVLVQGFILQILNVALGSIFRSMASGVDYTLVLSMPIYVPLGVFMIFLAFALISARGSLVKLGKMDVIAIMSEAA